MQSLNLGISAPVDAGKTSLTERLLIAAGAIDQLGSVERGDTQKLVAPEPAALRILLVPRRLARD
jgi:Elongation factor Tu GTP binding domain